MNRRSSIRMNRPSGLPPGWLLAAVVGVVAWAGLATGCGGKSAREVVVYSAQDQVYAEPLLARFEKQTGIRVRPVFDSEAVKAVGLANRLLAERSRPQADVFWNNEELRSQQLLAAGVLAVEPGLARFGHRSRRLVINTNKLALTDAPRSFAELTNSIWRGRVALAYPLFGTTATHFLAWRQTWGAERWLAWCRALAANRPFLVDGNSQVVNWVGRGEAVIGMTDSDDIAAGQREGLPVAALPLCEDALLIPNTASLVARAPHEVEGRELLAFLQSDAVREVLEQAGALERSGGGSLPGGLKPDWPALVREIEPATAALKEVFLR